MQKFEFNSCNISHLILSEKQKLSSSLSSAQLKLMSNELLFFINNSVSKFGFLMSKIEHNFK